MKNKLISGLFVLVMLWLGLGSSTTAQAQTTNLNTYLTSTTAPAGTTLEWHNAIPVSAANLMTGTAVSAAGPGTYYVVYNYGSSCYSNPMPIRIVAPTCPATTVDLTSLPSNAPSGSTTTYHTSATATAGNVLSSPTSATAGTYYVAYKDASGCYTNTSPIVVLAASCPVLVTGQVWDDADGNVAQNGSETGTNAGGPLYVNLVDATGTVVGSTTVSASGSYTLSAPASTTGLKLVLTNSPTASTPGTLPSGWVNTGEVAGTGNTAPQSTTLGQIELTTGTSPVTGSNFGIEKLPTPGSGTATVANAGGTTPVTAPPSAFTNVTPSTDTAPGSVTAIHIATFPTNVTSLTINGMTYTAGTFPVGGVFVPTDGSGAPTVPILIDPTNDASPVVITYTAVDNAGKESTTTGSATLNSTLTTTVSGSVWDDADGSVTQNGSETGTNAGGPLYVNLVDGTGTVIGSTTVSPSGTYSLTGVPANTTGLKLVLTNSPTATTPGTLPTGWVNTGEVAGTGNSAPQSTTLGQIELTTGTGAVSGSNFGIEKLPTPGSGTATVANAGGTSPVTAPPSAFTNVAPSSDTAPGSVTAIHIATFPTNVTSLTINGTTYTAGTFPAGGVFVPTDGSGAPTVPILVDPTNDTSPVVITYTAVDNAGKESTTTGSATLTSAGVPDLAPIIYALPATQYGTTNFTVVVDVYNLLTTDSHGLITVYVSKDPLVTLSFNPGSVLVGGKPVQNSIWTFDGTTDPDAYIFTTTQVIAGEGSKSLGLTGVLTPGNTQGTLTISTTVVPGSGGEVRVNNNSDADKIDYFKK